jgi:predicted nucleic acid-binding protein
VVGLDTAPLIYFIEEHPVFLPVVSPFFAAVARGDIRVVTSTITLSEVLVHPLRQGDADLTARYERILLKAGGFKTLSISPAIARLAAEFRSKSSLKTPDALQLAAAVEGGVSTFLTNDSGIFRITGLRTIVLSEQLARS